MAIVKNVVVVMWEYENKQWETKKEYKTIWKLITKDDWKEFLKIDVIPVARNWYANIYDKKKKEDSEAVPNVNDDDIPF